MFTVVPWHWLVFGLLLIISEMFLTTFATLWFGVAAIIVSAILWVVPINLTLQVIIWLILSITMVAIWFRVFKSSTASFFRADPGSNLIIGEEGIITVKPHSKHLGTVRFSAPISGKAEWMCQTQGEVVEVGDRVKVLEVEGKVLIVSFMHH